MAHTLHRLNPTTAKAAGPGKYADGGGLWLYKRKDGGAQWVFRYTLFSRRHEMGLGRYPEITLREARVEAANWQSVVRQGKDAIKERGRQRREAERNMHVLSDIALDAFESRKADLKGDGKAGRWFSPLELHVLPKLGKMPVSEIDQRDIRDTLSPIWHEKAPTARKAIDRLGVVLRHAAALGLDVDIQATDKARALLGKQRHEVKHIPSMPWQEVPAFYQSLGDGVTELALRFCILTGMRSDAIRHAHEDQIEGDVWTVPAQHMKARKGQAKDFRVALSTEAQSVIQKARAFARDGYLFPGVRKGVISDMTMSSYMKRRELKACPHGFRASLRNWLADTTIAPHEVAETCLGHVVDGKVVRTYRTTDFLEQRRALMERWARVVSPRASNIRLAHG